MSKTATKKANTKKTEALDDIRAEKLVYDLVTAGNIVRIRLAEIIEMDIIQRMFDLGYELTATRTSMTRQALFYFKSIKVE